METENMINDLVNLKIASLAKEKGFNIETDNFFIHNKSQNDIIFLQYKNDSCFIWQPTLYLLAKWLREVHCIDITIYRSFTMHNSYHYTIIENCDYDNEFQQDCIADRKYEDALLEAIYQGMLMLS